MKTRLFIATLLLILMPTILLAEPCGKDDFETKVTGVSQCLLMRRYGAIEPNAMIVWLHGDISSGDPANYHFPLAQKAAEELAASKVMSVALVRPGYPDGTGESSSVSNSHSGRSDHYTQENIGEVGGAIEKLRNKYKPKSVIIVGHSGGAATTALLLAMKPKLADAGVLVACPCDIVSWRAGRRAWSRSENPIEWAEKVSLSAKVVALTGSKDSNTSVELAKAYVDALRVRGIDATYLEIAGATHNSAFRSQEVSRVIAKLVKPVAMPDASLQVKCASAAP